MLGPLMNLIHVKDKLYIQDLQFIYNMKIFDNKLAQSCFSFACSDANSEIDNKIAYFRSEYNISVDHNTFSEGINLIKKSAQLSEELQLTIDHIWSLILVKSNNYSIEGFDLTEINDIISFLTTNLDIALLFFLSALWYVLYMYVFYLCVYIETYQVIYITYRYEFLCLYFTMNFIELYYILSLLRYMYMYMHILLLSSLLSLLFKLYVLVYHKIFICMNINK